MVDSGAPAQLPGIELTDYRPSLEFDLELAELAYAGVGGSVDHSLITAPLLRAMLTPTGTSATTLVLHRAPTGQLDALAAIRWPETLDSVGRVWGPVVHPDARGQGVARAMLAALTAAVAARPGVRVRTAPIPRARSEGWALFERAGWHGCGASSLLTLALPASPPAASSLPVRSARPGEYLDQALAGLVAAARPDCGYATARDTFQRWTADPRYVPEGLLLAEGERGLSGAALIYPSTRRAVPEPAGRALFSQPAPAAPAAPAEAELADLLVAPDLPAPTAREVRAALVAAALRAGSGAGAQLARAEAACPYTVAALRDAGFELTDEFRYYAPPPQAS